MKKYLYILLLILFSCKNEKTDSNSTPTIEEEFEVHLDSNTRAKLIESYDDYDEIKYSIEKINTREELNKILEKFGKRKGNEINNKVFITLNRKETKFLRIGDTCVIPDKIEEDMLAYSCFPYFFPEAANLEKLIVVSNYYQAYGCYENGKLVRFAACNTGKEKTPTFPGRYALVWKQEKRRSSLDSTWFMPYTFNFHRYAGNAFHQYDMPGYPASHSCIRQNMDDAIWLYKWGKGVKVENGEQVWLSGTPVIIFGVPDYAARRSGPWKNLKSNKDRPFELDFYPMEVEEALIPIAQIPESVRNWIPQRNRYKYAEDTLRARGIIGKNVVLTASVDFNKERRYKKHLKHKKMLEEAKKKQMEQKQIEQIEESKVNIELIKENLKNLEVKDTTKK